MYTKFFGFKEKPFSVVPDPDYFYLSEKHRMALTYLEYAVTESIGFIVLTGEIGTGKTTVIKHLIKNIHRDVELAVLFNTNVSADDLLKLILDEYEIIPDKPDKSDKSANIEFLNHFLIDKYQKGKRVLLIIDEAQNLSMEALEEVRMLSNLHTNKEHLIQVILVGQPELRARMQHPSLAQLAQRVAISYHLKPLNFDETLEYIVYRLKCAQAQATDIFTPSAVEIIHKRSKGIPRTINILCDAALVYAYADEKKYIGKEIIDQVIKDKEETGFFAESFPDARNVTPVVPNNYVNINDVSGELLQRINSIDAKIETLSKIVDWITYEMQSRIEKDRYSLVEKLENLLKEERKKSDSLLLQYSEFKNKLKELEKKVEDAEPYDDDNMKEAVNKEPGGSKILKWFKK